MRRLPRRTAWFLAALLTLGLATVAAALPESDARESPHTSAILLPVCRHMTALTNLALDECLSRQLLALQVATNAALRHESQYFAVTSRAAGWQMARATQTAFLSYVRRECLAEASPYQNGTIVPIIFGECAIALERDRLSLIKRVITNFQHGGIAGPIT